MTKTISIYCASSDKIDDIYNKDAEALGTLLGKKQMKILNGAGSRGLMRTVSDAVLSSGGTVTGVIPRFMVENGWCHSNLTEVIQTETMHERKKIMADMSDAAIALPGGFGTMEELLEIITWRQLGLYKKPVIILNTNNYYEPLFNMFRRATKEKFMREEESLLWLAARTPLETLYLIENQV